MKYEVGKTYTLTGDEPRYGTATPLSSWFGSRLFPVSAEVTEIDDEGDVWFRDKINNYVFVVDSSANHSYETGVDTGEPFDPVMKPEHYNTNLPGGVEVIDIITAQTADLSGMRAVAQANVIKYVLRWQKKNGVQDLEKARFYLDRLIGELS